MTVNVHWCVLVPQCLCSCFNWPYIRELNLKMLHENIGNPAYVGDPPVSLHQIPLTSCCLEDVITNHL